MEKVVSATPSQQLKSTVAELACSPLFKPALRTLNLTECAKLSYQRAKAFSNAYGLAIKDIQDITPKCCKIHLEPLVALDGGAFTPLAIHRDHRSKGFNRDILALSLPLVEAIGYRMAFEAAQEANISPKVLNLYESGVFKEDSALYAEKGGLSGELRREMEAQAADDLLPHLKGIMHDSGLQDYCNALMISRALWNEFVYGLETFEGDASPYLLARL